MAAMPIKLHRAVQTLRAGGLIAYPTESVWGFGCDPANQAAVMRLLTLKNRPVGKGLILVAANAQQFEEYLGGLDSTLQNKFNRPLAHPTTWLVPDNQVAPDWIKGDFKSIALRVSTYKLVVDLCKAFGGPIVSTSANISGGRTPSWPWQLHHFRDLGLDYILPGSLGGANKPSEIRDLISDKVFRQA